MLVYHKEEEKSPARLHIYTAEDPQLYINNRGSAE